MHKNKMVKSAIATGLCLSVLCSCTEVNDMEQTDMTGVETTAAETSVPATVTPQLDGYNLLWADEFDGDTLNEAIWNRELREPGWTNNELQEYTDSEDNIYVENGCLVLRALREDRDGTPYYTSGKVNSQNNA